MGIYFRHNEVRKDQKKMITDIWSAINSKKHIFCHAPCGIGKTDASISPALTYAKKENMVVLFLTPKISQHKIAMDVFFDLKQKYKLDIFGIDIIGRKNACSDFTNLNLNSDSFYYLCKYKRKKKECNFYNNTFLSKKILKKEIKDKLFNSNFKMDFSTFNRECRFLDICAYETALEMAKHSTFIVADYYQVLLPEIRKNFFSRLNLNIKDCIVIVDEAHNLSNRAISNLTNSISTKQIKKVEVELIKQNSSIKNFSKIFTKELYNLIENQLLFGMKNYEKKIKKEDLDSFVKKIGFTYDELIEFLIDVSFKTMEQENTNSACTSLAKFLSNWQNQENEKDFLRLIKFENDVLKISKRGLDPSILTKYFSNAHSSIFMSGTFLPLNMYREIYGFKKKESFIKEYESSFNKKNQLNLIVDSVTTRYLKRTQKEFIKIAKNIKQIFNETPGGLVCFFPSYSVLNSVYFYLEKYNLPILVQKEKQNPKQVKNLIDLFKQKRGIMMGVQGGSLSEGVDYNNGEIKTIIIVGIPFSKRNTTTLSIIEHFQEKFKKGEEYGYIYPAMTKVMQSAGRAIRKKEDKAAIIFLDERFSYSKYQYFFPKNLEFIKTDDPTNQMKIFFKNKQI